MAGARYWRVLIHSNTNSVNASIQKIEMASVAGGATLCTGGTASALSSANSSYTAPNAFDTTANFWVSAQPVPPDQWIQYLFPSAVAIAEVRLKNRSDGYGNGESPISWEIQYSNDGASFTSLQSYTSAPWTTPTQTQAFAVPPPPPPPPTGAAFVSQSEVEVLGRGSPKTAVSSSRLEVMGKTSPASLVSTSFLEALYKPSSSMLPPPRRRVFVGMT